MTTLDILYAAVYVIYMLSVIVIMLGDNVLAKDVVLATNILAAFVGMMKGRRD